jgi:hypothetical protein
MLEAAGIVEVSEAGDVVSLAADWLARLEEQRRLGKEIEAEELARTRYELKRDAFHARKRTRPRHRHSKSFASAEAVKRSHEARDVALAEEGARAKKESRLHDLTDEQAAIVRQRVREGMKQEFAIESVVARTTARRAVMPGSEQPERKMPQKNEEDIYAHGAECDCWICEDDEVVA